MEYLTAAEVAEKWKVSQRQVQRFLAANRIAGVKQFGKRFLIPADAEKPKSVRTGEKSPQPPTSLSDFGEVIAATHILWPRDDPDRILEMVSDERLRVVPEMWFSYLRGDFEAIMRRFSALEPEGSVKLCACHAAIAAAIALGDYPLFQKVENYLKDVATTSANPAAAYYAELGLANAYISAAAPDMACSWVKNGDFAPLPRAFRGTAAFIRARYFQWKKNYEAMLAIVQTTAALYASEDGIALYDAYWDLLGAVAYYALGRNEEAEKSLLAAIRFNLRYGFITPLADMVHASVGLVEKLIKQEFPEYHDAVVAQARRTAPNWIAFHNRFTKESITQILSIRDYQIALLAARGVPNKQIAEQFHISPGTLNNRMQVIYELLFISGKSPKKELAKYVF
jgi:DNA-binding CsgD family transcriptional regulator